MGQDCFDLDQHTSEMPRVVRQKYLTIFEKNNKKSVNRHVNISLDAIKNYHSPVLGIIVFI